MSHRNRLSVGDLFCGGGGFSEGFAQAGFRIAWGIDFWPPAVETFARNHPSAKAIRADIASVRPETLEPVDVLIGSPPCVHFSPANRGGNGDWAAGMRLVRRFLTLVRHLKPSYWVMENVPALLHELDEEMDNQQVQLHSGALEIPDSRILDSADFGTPQTRKRLFVGSFPAPSVIRSHDDGIAPTLRTILDSIPAPFTPVDLRPRVVKDPTYVAVEVPIESLRDHFEDTRWRLSEEELKSSEAQKTAHPVY